MPRVVEYAEVEHTLTGDGLECVYPNSGAFAFPRGAATSVLGWVGPADPTIRPEASRFVRRVAPPYPAALADLAVRAWAERLPGPAWLVPKSHWAYELAFGNAAWMRPMLTGLGVDAAWLDRRNDGTAIAFEPAEADALLRCLTELLTHLQGSDFLLAFPGRPVVCTIHHHVQLWWVTTDALLRDHLAAMTPGDGAS